MKEKRNFRVSERVKTGHIIYLCQSFKNNPICPHHGKRAILCEPPDEIGARRWFCIDCVAKALYEVTRENKYMRRILKAVGKQKVKEALKTLKAHEFDFRLVWHPVSGRYDPTALRNVRKLFVY